MSVREMEPTGRTQVHFKGLAHVIAEVWHVQNLQGRLAGWRPPKDLWFKSKQSAGRFPSSYRDVSHFSTKVFTQVGEVHPHYGQ